MSRERDDSSLSTGMSSAVARRQKARLEEASKVRQSRRGILTPQAEIILEWIASERKNCIELVATMILGLDVTESRVIGRLEAIQLHLQFLDLMKAKAHNLLRDMPVAPTPEPSDD